MGMDFSTLRSLITRYVSSKSTQTIRQSAARKKPCDRQHDETGD
ncbi:unnamed protein product [Knipowitschia caucasica]